MRNHERYGIAAGACAAAIAGSALAAPKTGAARVHQFPGGKGDVRDEMVQIIARDAKAAGVDLDIRCIRGASLFKPNGAVETRWINGQLDHLVVPARYASGKGARLRRDADARAG